MARICAEVRKPLRHGDHLDTLRKKKIEQSNNRTIQLAVRGQKIFCPYGAGFSFLIDNFPIPNLAWSSTSGHIPISCSRWKVSCLRWKVSCLCWKVSCLRLKVSCLRWKVSCLRLKVSCLRWKVSCLRWKVSSLR